MSIKETGRYIPGFDWVKLLGSILIVLSHFYLYGIAHKVVDVQIIALLGEVVPVFFMISGYLMYRSVTKSSKPYGYVLRYILKYGSVYFVLSFFSVAGVYLQIYQETDYLMVKSFLVDLCTLPFHQPFMTQLWFIPPLLLGVLINAPIWLKEKEKAFLWVLIPFVLSVIFFRVYGSQLPRNQALYKITQWSIFPEISYFFPQLARGVLFVYIGMFFAKHHKVCETIRISYFLLPFAILSFLELQLVRAYGSSELSNLWLTVSVILWSSLMFLAILRIKGDSLRKHHDFITIFSGITYFFHILEGKLMDSWIPHPLLVFLAVVVLNSLITWGFLRICRHSKKKLGVLL